MPILAQPRVWRSDLYRTKLEPLQLTRPTDGEVTFNNDMEFKRQARFGVIRPEGLAMLGDFLAPELVLTDADGTEVVIPLGNFVVVDISATTGSAVTTGAVTGRDITYLLARSTLPEEVVAPAGTNPAAMARQIIAEWGVPNDMILIPPSTLTLSSEMRWPPGESRLTVANDLLSAANMLHCWTDGLGRITTDYQMSLDEKQPVAVFGTEPGQIRVLPGVSTSPDLSRLRNRVTVRKVVPNEPTISYTATVTDESSPVHPDRLAERLGSATPVIFAGDPFEDHTLQNEAQARTRAESLLSEGASYYQRLRVETLIDPNPDGHQVIELDIRDGDYQHYSGRWWRRTWSIRLSGVVATMTAELNKTIPWK